MNNFFEDCSGKSVTVPNQTLSLKTLIERFTRGQSVATFAPVFNGSDDVSRIPIERMTKQEKIELARNLKQNIAEKQQNMIQANKQRAEQNSNINEINIKKE